MSNIKCNYSIQLNSEYEPITEITPGSRVLVETVNAFGDHFKNLNDIVELINNKNGVKHHHPLTGPIFVKNAMPGDVLKIKIHNIKVEKMGQAMSQTAGINPKKVSLFAERAPIISYYQPDTDDINYIHGMSMYYKPMLGIIGTAPKEGFIKTGHAARTGGNLDIPFLTEHTVVYLPVEVEGGYLYLGDIHGNQGYGELGGIALEASAIVDIEIDVLKPRSLFNNIIVVGKEPFSGLNALGIVGVATKMADLNDAILQSYLNAIDVFKSLFPTCNDMVISNLLTIIGQSFNGQAFSKTSESTSIIVVSERDLQKVKNDVGFSVMRDVESILFMSK